MLHLTDVLGRDICVGDTILYAGYGSPSLRLATVISLRERGERPELLVRLHAGRGHVSILHYPRRTFVLKEPHTNQGAE